jgi:hopanoid biosynthesis associated protein HpnK
VARARRLPRLGVGLHLVLVDGRPALPPDAVPDLVDRAGRFRVNMVSAGIRFFFLPRVRRQLSAEIEAQFAAFAATGLSLDHVNAHKHFHLHPTIAGAIARTGPRYGLRSLRAPIEPSRPLDDIEPAKTSLSAHVAGIWARLVARKFRRLGTLVPDAVFGLRWSGAMSASRLAAIVRRLPAGLTEIYCHPATTDDWPGCAPGYRYRDELAALTDASLRDELARRGALLGRFADFDPE